MPDPRTDQIAREAARLIETGRADGVESAVRLAAEALGARGAPLPGAGRVRKHAQAMSMQALGSDGYAEKRNQVWRIAEQVMTVFEHTMPDVSSLLVGRAAQGHIDAGVTIHIRLYTRTSISDLARSLIDFGYEDPAFQTIETRFGRLSQIKLSDEGYDIVLTRCMPEHRAHSDIDLVTDQPIRTASLAALRRRLDEASNAH